jgi:hypothetical protein
VPSASSPSNHPGLPGAVAVPDGQVQQPVPQLARGVEYAPTAPLLGDRHPPGGLDIAGTPIGSGELLIRLWEIAAGVPLQPAQSILDREPGFQRFVDQTPHTHDRRPLGVIKKMTDPCRGEVHNAIDWLPGP